MELIDKDALIAEIERRKNQFVSQAESFRKIGKEDKESYYAALASNMNSLSCFLDTLEVKEVENTELLKVRGYLVRDRDDYTAIYAEKPHRGKTEWVNGNDSCLMTINDARLVPDIEFEDEPVEVEVTLKRLKDK